MAKKTFEQGMTELQALVEELEGGELALEESFQAYERGMKLAASLKKQLAEGEARIVALRATLEGIRETELPEGMPI